MLHVKHSVYNVANEKLKFQLTSNVDVFCNIFVCLSKHMTYYKSVRRFKLVERLSLGIE